MSYKDKKVYNEYMNGYMNTRYHKRMQNAKEQLGGKCVFCGSTENLDFDHIDGNTKLFTIGKRAASISEKKFQEELVKCQLLCVSCHHEKHKDELVERMTVHNPRHVTRVAMGSDF